MVRTLLAVAAVAVAMAGGAQAQFNLLSRRRSSSPSPPCSDRCPSGAGCADTVLGACESDETCKSIMETRVAGERTQLVSMITRGHITPEGQEAATASGW